MSLNLPDVGAARFWVETALMGGAFLGRWLLGGEPGRRWLGPAFFAATSVLWIVYGLLMAVPAFVIGALIMLSPEIRAALRLRSETIHAPVAPFPGCKVAGQFLPTTSALDHPRVVLSASVLPKFHAMDCIHSQSQEAH